MTSNELSRELHATAALAMHAGWDAAIDEYEINNITHYGVARYLDADCDLIGWYVEFSDQPCTDFIMDFGRVSDDDSLNEMAEKVEASWDGDWDTIED